jgi:hypothetical protein
MSEFYIQDNRESTKNAFNKKIIYKDAVNNANGRNHNNVVNFNFGEKVLYGRIKRNGTPICMIERQNLRPIKNSADPTKNPLFAMHFVVDVFDEMCLQYEKCVQSGQIRADSEFLSNLKAYKAYANPIEAYNSYRQYYDNRLAGLFKKNNYTPENFSEFAESIDNILKFVSREVRFTLPGFVKSRNNSILTSAIAIEVANKVKYSNDDDKISKFIMDPNWEFFVQTCDSYGFMIDLNIPWRIVADLDSKIMKSRSAQFGATNVTSMLNDYYNTAHSSHFINFVSDLLGLYNSVKTKKRQKYYTCEDGSTKTVYSEPRNYTALGLLEEYGTDYFLKLYATLRIYEEIPNVSEAARNRLIGEILGYSKLDVAGIIEYFEILINQEFDKVGSFSYISKSKKAVEKSDFESGETSAISSY